MPRHMKQREMTKREQIETSLMQRFPGLIEPFQPSVHYPLVDAHKDGRFGFSNAAFALYSNGHNPRGRSDIAPFGLIYKDEAEGNVFSIGCFTRPEHPKENSSLIIVAPKGPTVVDAMELVASCVLSERIMGADAGASAVYVRFVGYDLFMALAASAFFTCASERPWQDFAPQEDESHPYSTIDLEKKRTESLKNGFNRFRNFLRKRDLPIPFTFRPLSVHADSDLDAARQIIFSHFEFLKSTGGPVSSVAEDHFNSISPEILGIPSVFSYIACLDNNPVSLFVGEDVGNRTVALYTPFTLRDPLVLPSELYDTRVNAMGTYVYALFFDEMKKRGFRFVKLGGSETKKLDDFKRHLGAKEDWTHWMVSSNSTH